MRKQPTLGGTKQGKSFIRISLNDGSYALVDKQDSLKVNGYKWQLSKDGYAIASEYSSKTKNNKLIYMHRLINATPSGLDTDHINGDKLDNRSSNLRSLTRSKNQLNRRTMCGVREGRPGAWYATIVLNRKSIFLGSFKSQEEALGARITAEECLVW